MHTCKQLGEKPGHTMLPFKARPYLYAIPFPPLREQRSDGIYQACRQYEPQGSRWPYMGYIFGCQGGASFSTPCRQHLADPPTHCRPRAKLGNRCGTRLWPLSVCVAPLRELNLCIIDLSLVEQAYRKPRYQFSRKPLQCMVRTLWSKRTP
jgi:hypothetical protein